MPRMVILGTCFISHAIGLISNVEVMGWLTNKIIVSDLFTH